MWDGSHTTAWNGGSNIQRRQRRRNDVTVGSVALSDLIYIQMYNNAEQQYEPLVWYGPGAQWDDSGIKHGHYNAMLWATHSLSNGQGWFITEQWWALSQTRTVQDQTTPDFFALRNRT